MASSRISVVVLSFAKTENIKIRKENFKNIRMLWLTSGCLNFFGIHSIAQMIQGKFANIN